MPEKKSDLLIVAMKPVKAGGAKGEMESRRVEPRQLTFVFADSPEGPARAAENGTNPEDDRTCCI